MGEGKNRRDAFHSGDVDAGVRALADLLGWGTELELLTASHGSATFERAQWVSEDMEYGDVAPANVRNVLMEADAYEAVMTDVLAEMEAEMATLIDKGMILFEPDEAVVTDRLAAEAYKAEVDQKIAVLDMELATLVGKAQKKERAGKSRDISHLKAVPEYVDACKVLKGLEPKHGFFIISDKQPP